MLNEIPYVIVNQTVVVISLSSLSAQADYVLAFTGLTQELFLKKSDTARHCL
jgi:hypothetical protein